MIDPSKGGSSLSQAFLQNQATQAGQLPTITQPQREGLPQIAPPAPRPQPAPVMGSMAPANPYPMGDPQFNIGAFGAKEGGDFYMRRAAENQRRFSPFGMVGRGMPQQQQAPYQPSQAQLLARAINERAQGRG